MSLKKIRILPDQYVFKQNEKGDNELAVRRLSAKIDQIQPMRESKGNSLHRLMNRVN